MEATNTKLLHSARTTLELATLTKQPKNNVVNELKAMISYLNALRVDETPMIIQVCIDKANEVIEQLNKKGVRYSTKIQMMVQNIKIPFVPSEYELRFKSFEYLDKSIEMRQSNDKAELEEAIKDINLYLEYINLCDDYRTLESVYNRFKLCLEKFQSRLLELR